MEVVASCSRSRGRRREVVVINIIISSSSSVLTPLRSHRRITVSRRSSSSSNISILDINSNNNSLHLRRLGLNKRTDRTCWAVTVAASVNLMHIIIINICGRTRRQCRRRCLPVEDEKEEKPNVGAWIGISNSNTKKSIERTRPRPRSGKKKKTRRNKEESSRRCNSRAGTPRDGFRGWIRRALCPWFPFFRCLYGRLSLGDGSGRGNLYLSTPVLTPVPFFVIIVTNPRLLFIVVLFGCRITWLRRTSLFFFFHGYMWIITLRLCKATQKTSSSGAFLLSSLAQDTLE